MAWETIERVEATPSAKPPPLGVRVSVRKMKGRGGVGGGFIRIAIAPALAEAAKFCKEEQPVRLLLGSDNDAGKICVMMDGAGQFVARGKPGKTYAISIGMLSARGLFSTSFETFERDNCEVIKPQNGQPVHFTFLATGAMLDAENG